MNDIHLSDIIFVGNNEKGLFPEEAAPYSECGGGGVDIWIHVDNPKRTEES